MAKDKKLTKKQMRVEIAKDVLKQLRRKDIPLKAACGYYVDGVLPEEITIEGSEEIQKHVDVLQANCEVCQKGALLLSMARLYDKVTVADVFYGSAIGHGCTASASGDEVTEKLKEFFSESQLELLESAFECCSFFGKRDYREFSSVQRGAIGFGMGFSDAKKRCGAIVKNIIDNDGTFTPAGLTCDQLDKISNRFIEDSFA